MQGHTVIQVNGDGENCILLYGGSNCCVTQAQIEHALDGFSEGDWLLLQNEINKIDEIVDAAYEKGLTIALNPSPCDEGLKRVDFDKLSWLMINEVEAAQITGSAEPEAALSWLKERYERLSVLITLGSAGSIAYGWGDGGAPETVAQPAFPVQAVDTTAAGDTYTGYFIAGLLSGLPLCDCMRRASKAAAVCVTRMGAADSIPRPGELDF